jgi:hypothetical protein
MASKDCKTCGPTTYVPQAKVDSVEEPVIASIETANGDVVQVDWRQTAYNVQTIVSVLEIEDVPATIVQEEEGKVE